jgi:nicotinamidase-related amidase
MSDKPAKARVNRPLNSTAILRRPSDAPRATSISCGKRKKRGRFGQDRHRACCEPVRRTLTPQPTFFKEFKPMTSAVSARDPLNDHLLTPKNCALVVIDYQPIQVSSVASRDRRSLVENLTSVARTAKLYGLPVVLSTVNVKSGINQPMIPQITRLFPEIEPIDRTSINAWEDEEFVRAVKATGRSKLVFCAIWTEVCLVFPALDALKSGFEVYAVVDAVGGTSRAAHNAGLRRLEQAGGKATSWTQFICELQRDWNRKETVPEFAKILFAVEGQ